ncbi:TonB family C-terminal domain-containing protein [Reichenbachiella faecimaris]|uniref:TonB family C-terminal domain-containing protein n=1 Tax=Reichenbachiella faecimaris TaxID=692418 RepID=A0A1W2GGZ2_REIFA|nr:energy transducer TonB [Reichenbachiella faecimaris]SMD35851.1 TonB family C-terminal domain-containing protein [Reichenbachiella faecimaris]
MKLATFVFVLLLSFAFAQANAQDEDKIYSLADEQPAYPGGMSAFFKYIQSNMQYPEASKVAGIEGRVFVEYVVEKDGSVSGAKILKSLNGDCDKEALRLVANCEKWTPGKIDGKAVRVKMALPLNFRLPR